MVTVPLHRHWKRVVCLAPHDHNVPDGWCFTQGIISHLFQRHDLPTAIAAVGRHEYDGFRIIDPVAQRLGTEATEYDAVHGADPRASQHGDRQFRHERHVERHSVAAPHAERLQPAGKGINLAVQVEVSQSPAVARLAFPNERCLVAPGGANVAIDAVDASIDLAADEPLGAWRLPLEHLPPRLDPLKFMGETLPECLGIRRRTIVDSGIGHVRRITERLGRRECTSLVKERLDFLWLGVWGLGH